jgi:hypothetical protein
VRRNRDGLSISSVGANLENVRRLSRNIEVDTAGVQNNPKVSRLLP